IILMLGKKVMVGFPSIYTHRKSDTLPMTVVVVLHGLGMASTYPERAIVLDVGQIVYDGKCHNLSDKFSKLTPPKVEV
ncbi:hypothetical protein QUA00_34645, partial [Microcoleus sp. T2B6]